MSTPTPKPPQQSASAAFLPSNPPIAQDDNNGLDALTPAQALELLAKDPVAFVKAIVDSAARMHLADLKEEAELRGVLDVFRNTHPEFQRFEPFILQEVATLLQNDPQSGAATWSQLLEKAMANFSTKFEARLKESVQSNPDEPAKTDASERQNPPYMESATNRSPAKQPPSFTRDQIARMSLADFVKNEGAINDAIQNNRIR